MEINELVENTNKAIERLRNDRSSLDESRSRRIAIRGKDGRVSGFKMNRVARKKISDAQIDRWNRVRIGRQSKNGPAFPEPMQVARATEQLDKKKFPFASKLQEMMMEKSPSYWIQNLADDLGLCFEHARKMVKGIAVPTDLRAKAIADTFGVDAGALVALAKADKYRRKYGEGSPVPIFNPEVAPFASAWPMLTGDQKSDLMNLLNKFLRENV